MRQPPSANLAQIYGICMLLMRQAKMITDCQDNHFQEMSLRHYHYLPDTGQRKTLIFHACMNLKAPSIRHLLQIHRRSFNEIHPGIEFLKSPMVENIATYVLHDIKMQIQDGSNAYSRLIAIQRILLKLISGIYDWLFKFSVASAPKRYLLDGLQAHVSSLLYHNKFTRNSDLHNTHIELHYKGLVALVNQLDVEFEVPASHAPVLLYLGECAALFERQFELNTCRAVFRYTPGTTSLLRDQYLRYSFLAAKPSRFLCFNRGYHVAVIEQTIQQCYQHYAAVWSKNAASFQMMCQFLNFIFRFLLKANAPLNHPTETVGNHEHFSRIVSLIQSGLDQLELGDEIRQQFVAALFRFLPQQHQPAMPNTA